MSLRDCSRIAELLVAAVLSSVPGDAATWAFAVSGDSRNCGDVAMPSIAAGAIKDGAKFYWHLGDFRAMYGVDEDIGKGGGPADLKAYRQLAWGDFILHQLGPFGAMPVFLSRGNHDEAGVKTRAEYLTEFAAWLDQGPIKEQRLRDDPADNVVKTYYHWIQSGVDFVTLDNAADYQFEPAQMAWFEQVLDRAAANPEVKTVVSGMHRALPDSLSTGHGMNDSPQGITSGRQAYHDLVQFRKKTGKRVYVLASHSHIYISDVYDTPCRREHPDEVLPGWIVGTAGAVRYRLPAEHGSAKQAETDVYGYLLGTVADDGSINFEFKRIKEGEIAEQTKQRYSHELIHWCFAHNTGDYVPQGPPQPPNCPAP